MTPLRDRMHDKLERQPNGCLLWTGGKDKWGYGRVHLGAGSTPQTVGAHRLALQQSGAEVGPDDLVLHGPCDNPACCEPTHLRVGTHYDNMQDRSRRGRCHGRLSDDDVREIRARVAAGRGTRATAEAFGVSRVHVQRIVSRKKRALVD